MTSISKLLMATMAVVSLVGCSTQAELKAERVGNVMSSNKDTTSVANCVSAGFKLLNKKAIVENSVMKNGNSVTFSLDVAMGRDAAMLVEVLAKPSGSESTYFSKVLVGESKLVKVIADCQL